MTVLVEDDLGVRATFLRVLGPTYLGARKRTDIRVAAGLGLLFCALAAAGCNSAKPQLLNTDTATPATNTEPAQPSNLSCPPEAVVQAAKRVLRADYLENVQIAFDGTEEIIAEQGPYRVVHAGVNVLGRRDVCTVLIKCLPPGRPGEQIHFKYLEDYSPSRAIRPISTEHFSEVIAELERQKVQ